MKKIGILTFHRANNYGAVLQAYALKQTLLSLHAQVQIVNYLCPAIEDFYSFWSGSFSLKWLALKVGKLLFLAKFLSNQRKFEQFRSRYLKDTTPVAAADIAKLNAIYALFITGSDQVFNPRITGFDKNYLLDFVQDNSKKYSYAASVAVEDISAQEEKFLSNYLKNFAGISVREKQTVEKLHQVTGKPILVHLDPTLLLTKQNWQHIASLPKNQSNYILLYLMDENSKIIDFTQRLSKHTGLKVIHISASLRSKTPFKSMCVTPQQWLGYFLGATYIVTNSFHGLVFSLNFNKPFFVDVVRAGDARLRNDRILNMLELTGFTNRLIEQIGTNYEEPLNFSVSNNILQQEKARALAYLKEIVNKPGGSSVC